MHYNAHYITFIHYTISIIDSRSSYALKILFIVNKKLSKNYHNFTSYALRKDPYLITRSPAYILNGMWCVYILFRLCIRTNHLEDTVYKHLVHT